MRMATLKLRGEFEIFISSIGPSALPRNGYGGIMSWWIVCRSAHGPQNNSRVIECNARVEPNDEYTITTFGTTTGIDPGDNILVTGEGFVVTHAVILPDYCDQ